MSDDEEMTCEAAAELLHISSTHINAIIDSGALGEVGRNAAGDRCISKAAVMKYKAFIKKRQARRLDARVEASERLGLYDGFDAVRAKADVKRRTDEQMKLLRDNE